MLASCKVIFCLQLLYTNTSLNLRIASNRCLPHPSKQQPSVQPALSQQFLISKGNLRICFKYRHKVKRRRSPCARGGASPRETRSPATIAQSTLFPCQKHLRAWALFTQGTSLPGLFAHAELTLPPLKGPALLIASRGLSSTPICR